VGSGSADRWLSFGNRVPVRPDPGSEQLERVLAQCIILALT